MPKAASLALFAISLSLSGIGCGAAIEPPRDASDRVVPVVERAKARDTFWVEHELAQARRPEPDRPRSISLGYVGQGKLAGGVGRDDLVEPRRAAPYGPMTWQEYVTAPTWRTNGGHGYATPALRPRCRGCVYGTSGYGAAPTSVPVGGDPTY